MSEVRFVPKGDQERQGWPLALVGDDFINVTLVEVDGGFAIYEDGFGDTYEFFGPDLMHVYYADVRED